MGRALRMYEAEGCYFVTARTFQSRLLLRPTRQLGEVLGGVLARAARLTGVELFAFVAASNHLHLLCRARDGRLSAFMQYVLANASKKVGPLVGWRGQLWERRFSAEPVLDDAAMEGRLRYILAHGVKEGLVRRVAEWPGLSCLPQLLGPPARAFPFYEWRHRWESGKLVPGGETPYSAQWATQEQLELRPLPAWGHLAIDVRQAKVRQLVGDIEAEGRRKHPRVLGLAEVLAQNPLAPPSRTKRSPRPWCHASAKELRLQFMARYAVFLGAFRRASQLFRSGDWTAVFPPLAFRPWIPVMT